MNLSKKQKTNKEQNNVLLKISILKFCVFVSAFSANDRRDIRLQACGHVVFGLRICDVKAYNIYKIYREFGKKRSYLIMCKIKKNKKKQIIAAKVHKKNHYDCIGLSLDK